MFVLHRGTNEYREIRQVQRDMIRNHGRLNVPSLPKVGDHVATPACYLSKIELIRLPHRDRSSDDLRHVIRTWGGITMIAEKRRCSGFIKYLAGRLPVDLIRERRETRDRWIRSLTLVAVMLTAVFTGLALLRGG